MKIETLKIKDLKTYEKNARVHPQKQIDLLAKNIVKFGFTTPVLIDKNNEIIAGHGRILAMQKLGKDEVPCVRMEKLSEEEVKALRLADNQLAQMAEWDMGLAVEELKGLSDEMVELTGFDKDLIIEPDEKDDEVPEIPEEPQSKLGDLYELGNHRVLCGDSTKIEDVEKLMDGKKADMVFTDPPYGVSYADKNKYLNTIAPGNRIQTPIENDHLDIEKLQETIIYPAFCRIKELLAEKSSYYITAPQGGDLLMMMMMMYKAGLPLRHMIIWAKNNHVLGRTDYNYKHEPILFGWVKTHEFYGNGKHKFSTWEIPKPLKSDLHPTMKPVELIVNAVLNSTKENNLVSDLFLGSGSTLIASEKTGRICYGMELDCKYTDVIVQRYCDYTGNYEIIKNGKKITWPRTETKSETNA